MRRTLFLCALLAALLLSACGGTDPAMSDVAEGSHANADGASEELIVFADASLTEALRELAALYRGSVPEVRLTYQFASSGELVTQIRAGAVCDLFLSAAPEPLDTLDGALLGDPERNPENLNLLVPDSRTDLLENRITLVVPDGNPKGIRDFEHLSALLREGEVLLAVGDGGEPVGQYARRIFDYYEPDGTSVPRRLAYGSDVKEIVTRVATGVVDGGVVYATDAASAGLTVMDTAAESMCGRVVCSAAILSKSAHRVAAWAFLEFLQSPAAQEVFIRRGFAAVSREPPQEALISSQKD